MAFFLDAHVHHYPSSGFATIGDIVETAYSNLESAATEDGDSSNQFGLVLTENTGLNVFDGIRDTREGTWAFRSSSDQACIIAEDSTGKMIFLFAGRQLISKENLEVLSLFSNTEFENKKYSLAELVQKINEGEGVPLLCWGVGKWSGKRGKIIHNFIETYDSAPYFVGDNGNRPTVWPYPAALKLADQYEIPIVSGSDPLPLRNHHKRIGTFGTRVNMKPFTEDAPVVSLKEALKKPDNLMPFGEKTSPFSFLVDQVTVNIRKRLPKIGS